MVLKERVRLNERLRRLGKAFVDGLADESDYTLQKKLLQYQLDGLVMPEADAAFDAGEKLENLGAVWEAASLQDKHALHNSGNFEYARRGIPGPGADPIGGRYSPQEGRSIQGIIKVPRRGQMNAPLNHYSTITIMFEASITAITS